MNHSRDRVHGSLKKWLDWHKNLPPESSNPISIHEFTDAIAVVYNSKLGPTPQPAYGENQSGCIFSVTKVRIDDDDFQINIVALTDDAFGRALTAVLARIETFERKVRQALRKWGATKVNAQFVTRNDVLLTRGKASAEEIETALKAAGIPASFTQIPYDGTIPRSTTIDFDEQPAWASFSVEDSSDTSGEYVLVLSEPPNFKFPVIDDCRGFGINCREWEPPPGFTFRFYAVDRTAESVLRQHLEDNRGGIAWFAFLRPITIKELQ